MREWRFKELSYSYGGAMSLTTPSSSGKCTSGPYFSALLAMNCLLPAELKFRENTVNLRTKLKL